jgi:hypothetical protein
LPIADCRLKIDGIADCGLSIGIRDCRFLNCGLSIELQIADLAILTAHCRLPITFQIGSPLGTSLIGNVQSAIQSPIFNPNHQSSIDNP